MALLGRSANAQTLSWHAHKRRARRGHEVRRAPRMSTEVRRESLEEEATHLGGEARMLLPGVQTFLGFQLMSVFNQRFELFTPH